MEPARRQDRRGWGAHGLLKVLNTEEVICGTLGHDITTISQLLPPIYSSQ